MTTPPYATSGVGAAFDALPDQARAHALSVRKQIFEMAAQLQAGPVEESLKWGQPSYKAAKGTPIRLAYSDQHPDVVQLLVHCQTSLVEVWRSRFPDLIFQGNRALFMSVDVPLPDDAVAHCIQSALQYHA